MQNKIGIAIAEILSRITVLWVLVVGLAMPTLAPAQDERQLLDIPVQPVATTLEKIAAAFELDLELAEPPAEPLQQPIESALTGEYNLAEALNAALTGTDIDWREENGSIQFKRSEDYWPEDDFDDFDDFDEDFTDEMALDDIIVTATKREQSVRDIAGSVTALDGVTLEQSGIVAVEDIIDEVPGVNLVEPEPGSARGSKAITIRGISASGFNTADTVGLFIGDVPFSDVIPAVTVFTDVDAFDLASVELLKGPVGTLFGGSALNGAIRYVPVRPEFDLIETKAYAEYQDVRFGEATMSYGAALNVPILDNERLALRLSGSDRREPGWVDSVNDNFMAEDVNFSESESLRAALRSRPIEALELGVEYATQQNYQNHFQEITSNRNGALESTLNTRLGFIESEYELMQGNASYAFDWADLQFIAAHIDKENLLDRDTSGILGVNPDRSVLEQINGGVADVNTQELRLVSPSGEHFDWLVGAFNYRYNFDAKIDTVSGDEGLLEEVFQVDLPPELLDPDENPFFNEDGLTVNSARTTGIVTERAVFGETNWRFLPKWKLTTGLRLYRFEYDVVRDSSGAACVREDPNCALSGFSSTLFLKDKQSGVSPKLGLTWDITDAFSSYVSAARGFRFGGINRFSDPEIPPVFGSDSLWNYEIGLRTDWFEQTLRFDITAFFIDWQDAQIGLVTSNGLFNYTDNAGRVEGKGAEAQLIWRTPLRGLDLDIAAAYADIVLAEEANGIPAGTRWPRAPDWQTRAELRYSFDLGKFNTQLGIVHSYFGEAIGDPRPGMTTTIFDYEQWDAQLLIQPPFGSLWPELSINLNNLTDTRGLTGQITPGIVDDGQVFNFTQPRTLLVRSTFRF